MKNFLKFMIVSIFVLQPGFTEAAKKKKKKYNLKVLSKKQINKLGKLEQEYYLKKLALIFAKFEMKENQKRKFASKSGFSFSLFDQAYAAESGCVAGGHLIVGGTCNVSQHSCKAPDGFEKGFLCAKFYKPKPVTGRCIGYNTKDKGDLLSHTISKPCARLGVSLSGVEAAEEIHSKYCTGVSSSGCRHLAEDSRILAEETLGATQVDTSAAEDEPEEKPRIKLIWAECESDDGQCQLCWEVPPRAESEKCSKYKLPKEKADAISHFNQFDGMVSYTDLEGERARVLRDLADKSKCNELNGLGDKSYRNFVRHVDKLCKSPSGALPRSPKRSR